MFPEVIDSSMISEYRACAAKFKLTYIDQWKPKQPNVHLHAGASFARGIEVARRAFYEQGRSAQDAVALGLGALLEHYGDFQAPEDSAKTAPRMAGALEFYFERYPLNHDAAFPVLMPGGRRAIEFNFVHPLPLIHPDTGQPLQYCGRSDAIQSFAGGVFGFDEKTTTQLGASWGKQWGLRGQFTGYCLLPETEVLTKKGWTRLDQLEKGKEIIQWTQEGILQWAVPSEIHCPEFDGEMTSCEGKVNFTSTPEHRQVVWDTYTKRYKNYTSVSLPKRSGALRFLSAGLFEGGAYEAPTAFIRLLVAIQADGSWKDNGVRFSFVKHRKAERLEALLAALDIPLVWGNDADGTYRTYIKSHWVDTAKELLGERKLFGSWLLTLSAANLKAFIEEVGYWDGSVREDRGWMYFSGEETNIDWVRTIAALTGHYSSVHTQEGWKSDSIAYRVNITEGCEHSPHLHKWSTVPYKGKVWCVTVPSSYFLIRSAGRTMITGNCWGAREAGIAVQGWVIRGVSILKTKYETQECITYRDDFAVTRWYTELLDTIQEMIHCYQTKRWTHNLDKSCSDFGGCQFLRVCDTAQPLNYLETSHERRHWDPVTRIETLLP